MLKERPYINNLTSFLVNEVKELVFPKHFSMKGAFFLGLSHLGLVILIVLVNHNEAVELTPSLELTN